MEVVEAAENREASGAEVLHLEVGQPLTPAPAGALAAAHKALDNNVLGYAHPMGLVPLRRRIAEHYQRWYDQQVDPDQIMVTVGASGGFTLAFLAAFDPGERVALAVPGYPCYRNTLIGLGVEVEMLVTTAATNYQPTLEMIVAAHERAPLAGVMVTSPSNPTGTMIDPAELGRIGAWCDANQVVLISDEIYHGLTYEGSARTALEVSDHAIIVNSFSKYFSMTGWRLGWLVLPERYVRPVVKFGANLVIGASTLSQFAAAAAFDCHDELEGHIDRYRVNRELMLNGLRAAGFDNLAPANGAFYVYADVSHLSDDSQALCVRWLDELGIAATPGVDFDPIDGHHHVRFSFCGSGDDIEQATRLLAQWQP